MPASGVHAQQSRYTNPSASSLKAVCKSAAVGDEMYCLGYISGWCDTYTGAAYPAGSEGERILFRFQDGVTNGQIKRMFMKYVEEHPEIENQSAAQVLIAATRPVVEYMVLDKNGKSKTGDVWKLQSGN